MHTRTAYLIAVHDALASGLNIMALAFMEMHDKSFPDQALRPAYDRLILSRLNSNRHIREITP